MAARPAPDAPGVVRPGVRVVRRKGTARAWGIEVRVDGHWMPVRRASRASRSGMVDAWWFTRASAVEAALKLEVTRG